MSDIIMYTPNYEGYRTGDLPGLTAPLATAWVPRQRSALPKYEPEEALIRGTLFPGLDLPFKNIVNTSMPDTPAGELMALDFILNELVLYLDTHKNDAEAFETYKYFLALAEEGRNRYTQIYGPVRQSDLANETSFTWLSGPWPWEYTERMGSL